MLDVTFVFSFEFIRAGQSRVNAVLCTPGALSAYRREIVARVLNRWLHQTFCGRPANIGEDRAMTNLILESGSHVVFQQNAKVYTEVPIHYKKLTKMFLRWARSNIRETIVMSRFAFRRFREGSMTGARINLLLGWMALTKAQLALAAHLGTGRRAPDAFRLQPDRRYRHFILVFSDPVCSALSLQRRFMGLRLRLFLVLQPLLDHPLCPDDAAPDCLADEADGLLLALPHAIPREKARPEIFETVPLSADWLSPKPKKASPSSCKRRRERKGKV